MINADAALTQSEPASAWLGWRRAGIEFGLLAAVLALLIRDSLQSMASIWMTSSIYHHGLLAAPIAVWLIVRREDWREASPIADGAGVIVIAASCAFWLLGRAAGIDLFAHLAFVAALIGAVIAVFGGALARRWAFALGFLFFMVPFGEELTPALQQWASIIIAGALNLSGVETARDGFMLTTSAGRFEVAPSCAGLRFLLASAMISTLVAHLAFAQWRKQATFIAAALIAAILANWLRAYLIVLIATFTDRRIGIGPEHVALGWIFYSVLIVAMIALARRFADAAPIRLNIHCAPTSSRRGASLVVMLGIGAALVAAAYDSAVVSAQKITPAPIGLPALLAKDFKLTGRDPMWNAHAPGADLIAAHEYQSGDGAAVATVAYFTHDRAKAEIAGGRTRAADGEDWRRIAVSSTRILFNGDGRRIRIETLENSAGQKIDVATLYWLGDKTFASALAVKLDIAARRLTGRPTEGGVLFVAASHDASRDPQATIGSFLSAVEPIHSWRSAFRYRN